MSLKNPIVSVIVPIYNVAPYLSQCLDSILKQSFVDFEVILVDDGSKDKSGMICDNYAAKDSRISVFHQSNQGVSKARNVALDYAKGEYVIFMDADDYWYVDNCLETLLATAVRTNADIVRGEYKKVTEKGEDLYWHEINSKRKHCANETLSSAFFLRNVIQGEFFLWLFLIRRDIIQDIRFCESRIFLEDMDFYCRILLKPLTCVYIPLCFYAYRQHSTNASGKRTIKNLEDSLGMCERFQEYAEQAKNLDLKKAFLNYQTLMYYWTLGSIADCYFSNRRFIAKHLKLEESRKHIWSNIKKYSIINRTLPYVFLPAIVSILILKGRNWLIWHANVWRERIHKAFINK